MNDNILLVDDDPGAVQVLGKALAGMADLRFATNGEDALRLAGERTPDLVLLDVEMRGMNGYRVLDALKERPEMIDVPIIFVTSHSGVEFEVSAFAAGAADFISKPISPPLVLARVGMQLRVKHMAEQLRRAACTDALTGVANRRKFDETLQHEWQRARRRGDPISVLMIDVDHFKLYNDRYGHPQGDASLRLVAQALVGAARRSGDLVARCGGEEFALLLPQTARDGAAIVADRVLRRVAALEIAHTASTTRHLTVSIGIASYDERSPCWMNVDAEARNMIDDARLPCTAAALVMTADRALYAAKRAGRAQAKLEDVAAAGGSRVVIAQEAAFAGPPLLV